MTRARAMPFLIAIVTLIVFARIAGHEFINWDDPYTILDHHPLLEYWKHGWMGLWIPLTYTVWAALASVSSIGGASGGATSGPNPWIFHSASIILHVCNALLVYRIVRKAVNTGPGPACIGAMLFAIHPIQIEAVAWASGMKDLLCATLVLIAIERHLFRANLVATAAFALSMLAKPSGAVAIPIAAIIDRVLLNIAWKQIARDLSPWIGIAIPIGIVARVVQSTIGVPVIPIVFRPLIATDAIAFYLWKVFWPVNFAPDYGRLASVSIARNWIYLTWIAPFSIAAIAWAFRKSAKPQAAGGMIFLAALAPVLSFTPFLFQFYSTVADHYVYLPMLGVAIAAAIDRRAAKIAAVLVIVLLGALAFVQAGYWRDSEAIFRHNLAVNSNSAASENNLGAALAAEGNYAGAIDHYNRALALSPANRISHSNLAQIYALLDQPDKAIDHLEQALMLWDNMPAGLAPRDSTNEHFLLALFLEKRSRHEDARRHLAIVLAAKPNHAEAKALLEKLNQPTTR